MSKDNSDERERARLAAELRALADGLESGAPEALRKARRAVASTHDDTSPSAFAPSARSIEFDEFAVEDAIEFDEFGAPILRKRIEAPPLVQALWAMQWAWVALRHADVDDYMQRALFRIGEVLGLPDLERHAADLKAWALQKGDPSPRTMLAWLQVADLDRSSERFSERVNQNSEAIRKAEQRWAKRQQHDF